MSYLLDTNICSAHIRRPAGLMHRFVQHGGQLYISTIALAELYVWAHQHVDPLGLTARINRDLLQDVSVVDFDQAAAEQFGKLRVELKRQGITVSPLDLQIAAIAMINDFTVVTHNVQDFEVIPGLRIEDWLMP